MDSGGTVTFSGYPRCAHERSPVWCHQEAPWITPSNTSTCSARFGEHLNVSKVSSRRSGP